MSAGMAVICTDHAGIRDLVADKENAIYVRAKCPEDICDALEKLNRDRQWLKNLSQANREKVFAEFTEEKYITRMAEVLSR